MAITFTPYTIGTKTTANSYISVARLDELVASNVFIDSSKFTGMSSANKEKYLMNATDIIEQGHIIYSQSQKKDYIFISAKFDTTQRLTFPRVSDGVEAISYDIELLTAQITSSIINNTGLLNTTTLQDVKVKQVGDLKLEYFEANTNESFIDKLPVYTQSLLIKYLKLKTLTPFVIGVARG